MVDVAVISKYSSLIGTAMGIGLGITPIVPFIKIIKGEENVKIFPESMIFFNILCPILWLCYWVHLNNFIPFFSAIFGFTLGVIFSTIYLYYYLGKNIMKWLLALLAQFVAIGCFHYILIEYTDAKYIGFAAMLVGIFTSIAPAQNVLNVIKEGNHKLIPIWSCIFGGLCNFSWLIFGITLMDWYNIIPNAICFLINLSNSIIWCYFYSTSKKEEKEDKEEQLKDDDEEH